MSDRTLSAAPARLLAGALAGLLGAGPPAIAAGPGGGPALAPTLEGNSWMLAAVRDGTGLVEGAAAPRPARLRLEAGRLSGSAGCNLICGSYSLSGTALSFKANLTSTMMACPEPLMKQEQAVGTALTRVASYRLDGDLLEFLDGAGQVLLRFQRQAPAPLVGQVWQLSGYHGGTQVTTSAVRAGTEITLEFRDDGTLGGSDGCNRYMSGYTLAGDALTIGPLASTRLSCKGPEGAAVQARDYAAVLGRVSGYRIEGGELTLLGADGKPAAHFRSESGAPTPGPIKAPIKAPIEAPIQAAIPPAPPAIPPAAEPQSLPAAIGPAPSAGSHSAGAPPGR